MLISYVCQNKTIHSKQHCCLEFVFANAFISFVQQVKIFVYCCTYTKNTHFETVHLNNLTNLFNEFRYEF